MEDIFVKFLVIVFFMDCKLKKEVVKIFWVWNDGRVERFKIIYEFNKLVLKDVEEKFF